MYNIFSDKALNIPLSFLEMMDTIPIPTVLMSPGALTHVYCKMLMWIILKLAGFALTAARTITAAVHANMASHWHVSFVSAMGTKPNFVMSPWNRGAAKKVRHPRQISLILIITWNCQITSQALDMCNYASANGAMLCFIIKYFKTWHARSLCSRAA